MWDEKAKNTLRMDLWTKEMSVEEMKQFFHQTLLTMADTFERATGDTRITGDMRDFCYYFAERMNLLEK
jgi:gliding motility-associated protein GldC